MRTSLVWPRRLTPAGGADRAELMGYSVRQHLGWRSYPTDRPTLLACWYFPRCSLAALALGLLLHWARPVHPLPALPARLLGVVCLIASGLLARSAEAAMKRA
jgi:hypothetical protein